MTPSTDETPRAWQSQTEFLAAARSLLEYVFLRLGIEEAPRLALLGCAWWESEEYKHPAIAELDPRITWVPALEEWRKRVEQGAASLSEGKRFLSFFTGAAPQAIAFQDVVIDELRQHDASTGCESHVSQSARIGAYDCVFVVQFAAGTMKSYPHALVAGGSSERSLYVGLLKSIAEAALARILSESRKSDRVSRQIVNADIDDVLRSAGNNLLSDVSSALGSHRRDDLYAHLNAISSLRYERSEARAKLLFALTEYDGPLHIRFVESVPLAETVWSRKFMQLASGNVSVVSDPGSLLGLGSMEQIGGPGFWVRLKGQQHWEVGCKDQLLADVRFGLPSFPARRLDKARFDDTWRRVFPSEIPNNDEVWRLIERVIVTAQGHGALIVVGSDAQDEATRLSAQAMPITPTTLSTELASRVTAIDGAVLLDPSGVCHAIGVVLDGPSYPLGTPSRGARFNSALRYVMQAGGLGRLAIVVSEDGQVDLIPRLRPRIRRSEILAFIERLRSESKDKSAWRTLRRECIRMAHYMECLPDDKELLQKVVVGSIAWDGPARQTSIFDPHDSDIIEDA